MSGGMAWAIRRHCLEFWRDLVLHGIGKSTCQHLTTKYLKIGFWISPKARGFWLNGLRRKLILKNGSNKKTNKKTGNWEDLNCLENYYFCMVFYGFVASKPGKVGGHEKLDCLTPYGN